MDIELKEDFMVLWKRFFGAAELPIVFYFTDEEGRAELVKPNTVARRCVIPAFSLVRKGAPYVWMQTQSAVRADNTV